jgi:hypothetical protein
MRRDIAAETLHLLNQITEQAGASSPQVAETIRATIAIGKHLDNPDLGYHQLLKGVEILEEGGRKIGSRARIHAGLIGDGGGLDASEDESESTDRVVVQATEDEDASDDSFDASPSSSEDSTPTRHSTTLRLQDHLAEGLKWVLDSLIGE